MISESQRQGAYSGTVPESIFLMALKYTDNLCLVLTQQNLDHTNRSPPFLNASMHVLKPHAWFAYNIAYNSDERIAILITIVETSVQTEAIICNNSLVCI